MKWFGRLVLVTGGMGWLGRRVVGELLERGATVRVLARTAASQRGITTKPDRDAVHLQVVYGDVGDPAAVGRALERVAFVIHLAAEKHVERSEREPAAAVRTNVCGTLNLLSLARAAEVEHIVAASSDKASQPAGVLGTTKFLMERLLCEQDRSPVCTAVRLGGLLASGDSVLQRWKETAHTQGHIEVTDPDMTRFLMTADDAVERLLEAFDGRGREIVAPALTAYRLGDLARVFAEETGVQPIVVGSRPGEKVHDTLVSAAEAPFARREGRCFFITPGRRQVGVEPYTSRDAKRLDMTQLQSQIRMENAD